MNGFRKLLNSSWIITSSLFLVFVFTSNLHAVTTSIGLSDFSGSETVIDFNSITNEAQITNEYTGNGVTFSGAIYGMTNSGDIAFFPNNGGGVIASNWLYGGNGPQGFSFTATFTSNQTKVGFYVETNSGDDTTIEVLLDNDPQGSVVYNTGPADNVIFIGVEEPDGFNSVTVTVQNDVNGFLAIDDFRFESMGTPPKAIPTLSEWGMIIMSLMLAGSAFYMIRRRQTS